MSASARLGLPFLSPGQAQKEFFHNEALQTLDTITAAAVEEEPRNTPPAAPTVGTCYIVGNSPTDEWSGKSACIAGYSSGGVRFIAPLEGMTTYVKSSGTWAIYRAGSWEVGTVRGTSLVLGGVQVVGGRLAAIVAPSGGAIIDAEGRSAIEQILEALRQHGLIES